MVLDFEKEAIKNFEPNQPRFNDVVDLLKKWGYKTDDLNRIEITFFSQEFIISLGYIGMEMK